MIYVWSFVILLSLAFILYTLDALSHARHPTEYEDMIERFKR